MKLTIEDENGDVIEMESRRDADGRTRWYDQDRVDSEVSGRSVIARLKPLLPLILDES